jgi:carbonic anhydrase
MKKLIAGIAHFQSEVFPKNRHLYEQLAAGQQPETLFICCADSRVVPNEFMQTKPGELFICRNAGNIVPPYGNVFGGTAATVEYAAHFLKVKHIVVCGHSDCGAMRALMNPEKIKGLSAIEEWIRHADRVTAIAKELHGDLDEKAYLDRLIEENVIAQLDNLATYPSVAAKLRGGCLQLHGMTFDIATGEVKMLERKTYSFRPIREMAEEYGVEQPQLQST